MCHFLINLRALARSAAIWYAFFLSFRLTPLDAHNHWRLMSESWEANGRCHCSALNWFFVGNAMALVANDEGFMSALRGPWGSIESTIQLFLPLLICTSLEFRIVHHFLATGRPFVFVCPQRKGHLECGISTHLSFNPIRKLILNCASGPRTPARMRWRMTESWCRQSWKVD